MHTEKPCTCRLTSDHCDHTLTYVLPGGRIVAVHSDVARGAATITYSLADGTVVVAIRSDLAVRS